MASIRCRSGSGRLGTIDVRDMGESAALDLIRREDSDLARPTDRINLPARIR
jgi:hypothetical protein